MTKEKAIEIAKDFSKMDFSNPMGWTGYYDTELNELSIAMETVLNMLKEKDKEIETLKRDFKIVNQECSRLERKEAKKEKQTDLMAEYISKIDIEEDICIKNKTNPDWCNEDYTNCKDCIKQYFERQVEECLK